MFRVLCVLCLLCCPINVLAQSESESGRETVTFLACDNFFVFVLINGYLFRDKPDDARRIFRAAQHRNFCDFAQEYVDNKAFWAELEVLRDNQANWFSKTVRDTGKLVFVFFPLIPPEWLGDVKTSGIEL